MLEIWKLIRRVWVKAKKQYDIYVDARTKGRDVEMTRRSVAKALNHIATVDLLEMHFKGFEQHKETIGNTMFQMALDYYKDGHQDPGTKFILPAVEYFKTVKKWGDVEAQRVAVIWAMLAVVWNDIDTWIGVMGGKLEFTLKGELVTGGVQQKAKKKARLDAKATEEFLKEGTGTELSLIHI